MSGIIEELNDVYEGMMSRLRSAQLTQTPLLSEERHPAVCDFLQRLFGRVAPVAIIEDKTKLPAVVKHELSARQSEIAAYLWGKDAVSWYSLPDRCWQNCESTHRQEDRTIQGALERLQTKFAKNQKLCLSLEISSENRTVKLVRTN